MNTAKTDCPVCGKKDSLAYSQWTENQSPLGSGEYWPMEMSDFEQDCGCELTDDQIEVASGSAWTTLSQAHEALAAEWADIQYDAQQECELFGCNCSACRAWP
jgi:hypothetical protein